MYKRSLHLLGMCVVGISQSPKTWTIQVWAASADSQRVFCSSVWPPVAQVAVLYVTPIKLLGPSLPGQLRHVPHAPSPGWHAFDYCCC